MSTAAAEERIAHLDVEPRLVSAVSQSVGDALTMCNASARCVGISAVSGRDPGNITGVIGVHGKVSGFVTVNIGEAFAIKAVGGLLHDTFDQLTTQVVDGVGEITNMIVGGMKGGLAGSHWTFSHITVPSVIIGPSYHLAFAKGLDFVSMLFEHENVETVMHDDRLMQVSLSLLRL